MRFMLYGDIADHPETIEIEEKTKINYTLTYQAKDNFKRDHGSRCPSYSRYFDESRYNNVKDTRMMCNQITKVYNTKRDLYDQEFNYEYNDYDDDYC